MSIMRPSHKQHVGLLPDDVSRGPKLSKSLSCVASLDSAEPLSSYHIDALASRLSPDTKDICSDNSTTVGAHRGASHTVVLSSWRDLSRDQEACNFFGGIRVIAEGVYIFFFEEIQSDLRLI